MSISINMRSVSHSKPSLHQKVWLKSHWKNKWIMSSYKSFWHSTQSILSTKKFFLVIKSLVLSLSRIVWKVKPFHNEVI
jgi:hypothetical protein